MHNLCRHKINGLAFKTSNPVFVQCFLCVFALEKKNVTGKKNWTLKKIISWEFIGATRPHDIHEILVMCEVITMANMNMFP